MCSDVREEGGEEETGERELSSISFRKGTNPADFIELEYFCKGPISKYSHSAGVGLQHRNLTGGHNSIDNRISRT